MPHDREIVRDEQIGEFELALQVLQQVDDLRLHRNVERRDRLVADDEARLAAQGRARCRCAGAGRRRTRADSARAAERGKRTRSSSFAHARRRAPRVGRRRGSRTASAMVSPTRHARIERAVGVLEDDLHAAAAPRAARRCRERRDRRRPSNRTAPAVGSIRRNSRRPVVDLPQPDSPTRPSVSPRAIVKIDAVDGAAPAARCRRASRRGRAKILGQACALRSAVPRHAASSRSCDSRTARGTPRAMTGVDTMRSGGGSRHCIPRASGQRGAKRQPSRHRADRGHRAFDRHEPSARSGRSSGREASSARV